MRCSIATNENAPDGPFGATGDGDALGVDMGSSQSVGQGRRILLTFAGYPVSGPGKSQVKQVIDLLPVVAFFGVYLLSGTLEGVEGQDRIYYATAALMVASALQIAYLKVRRMEVSKQNWFVFWAAIVFGTMTLVFRNPLFIQWRGSVVSWVMALALIGSRFIGNGHLIKRMMGKVLALPDRAWRDLTYGWAAVFATSGGLNLLIAYNFAEETWVTYKFASGFVVPVLLIAGSGLYLYFTRQIPMMPASEASQETAKERALAAELGGKVAEKEAELLANAGRRLDEASSGRPSTGENP